MFRNPSVHRAQNKEAGEGKKVDTDTAPLLLLCVYPIHSSCAFRYQGFTLHSEYVENQSTR